MNKPIIIHGSIAYDTILNHPDPFSKSLNNKHLDKINVAFGVVEKREELGGTGGNIAYNCNLLDLDCFLFTKTGKDSELYMQHLNQLNHVSQKFLISDSSTDCAHAYLISDLNKQQIIAFYPGTLIQEYSFFEQEKELKKLINLKEKFPEVDDIIFHLAPENPYNTMKNAEFCMINKQLFFFDPGQSTPFMINHFGYFQKESGANHQTNLLNYLSSHSQEKIYLEDVILCSKAIFVNEYEMELMNDYFQQHYGLTCSQFIAQIKETCFDSFKNQEKSAAILKHPETFLINTLGSQGALLSSIRINEIEEEFFPVVKAKEIVDSTGCGDAFRAGFLLGFSQNKDIKDCMQLGSIMGSLAIESFGGQNHHTNKQQVLLKLTEINVQKMQRKIK